MIKYAKYFAASAFLAAAIAPLPATAGVKIIGKSFSWKDVCPGSGNSRCAQDSSEAKSMVVKNPIAITIDSDGTPMLDQYLGREFTTTMAKGMNYCGNVFAPNPIADFAAQQDIDYLLRSDSKTLNLDFKADRLLKASGDFDAVAIATAAGIPAASMEQVTAAINLAYKKSKKRTITLKGEYEFWEINPALTGALNSVAVPAELQPCRTWMEQGNTFTTSLTGFRIDEASVSSDMKSAFDAALTARLTGALSDAQIAAISASFNSTVEKKIEGAIGQSFQLLSMSHFMVR